MKTQNRETTTPNQQFIITDSAKAELAGIPQEAMGPEMGGFTGGIPEAIRPFFPLDVPMEEPLSAFLTDAPTPSTGNNGATPVSTEPNEANHLQPVSSNGTPTDAVPLNGKKRAAKRPSSRLTVSLSKEQHNLLCYILPLSLPEPTGNAMQRAITGGQNAALIADVKHTYPIQSGVSMSLEPWQVAVAGNAVEGYTLDGLEIGEPFRGIVESAVCGLKEKIAAVIAKHIAPVESDDGETDQPTVSDDNPSLGGPNK